MHHTNGTPDAPATEPQWHEWNVPSLREPCLQTNVKVEPSRDSTYDYWLSISTLEKGQPIQVPVKLAAYHKEALTDPKTRQVRKLNSSVQLNKRDGVWWLTLSYDEDVRIQTVADAPIVGIDAGIANFVTTSTGKHYGSFHKDLRARHKRDRAKRRRKAKLRVCFPESQRSRERETFWNYQIDPIPLIVARPAARAQGETMFTIFERTFNWRDAWRIRILALGFLVIVLGAGSQVLVNAFASGTQLISVKVTAYASEGVMADGNWTYMGACAVPTTQFPFGTIMALYNADGSFNRQCTAEDSVGDLEYGHISLSMPGDMAGAVQWGVHYLLARLLRAGWGPAGPPRPSNMLALKVPSLGASPAHADEASRSRALATWARHYQRALSAGKRSRRGAEAIASTCVQSAIYCKHAHP